MASETFTLELVSPAFLAGADQSSAESCELRVPSLRGQLRWWWRTLHAAHVDVPTLRRLEAAVWGSTDAASPVRLSLAPVSVDRKTFPFKQLGKNKKDQDVLVFDGDAARAYGIAQPPRGIVPGALYVSYGMDEMDAGDLTSRKTRFFVTPGSSWKLNVRTKAGTYQDPVKTDQKVDVPESDVLEQARAALSLLCRYGGVGSKARKGFGSFADMANGLTPDACMQKADLFRKHCELDDSTAPDPEALEFSAFDSYTGNSIEVSLDTKNVWTGLDRLGAVVQEFARKYKHRLEKAALGLPRKIHGPNATPLPHQRDPSHSPKHQPPVWLGSNHPHLESSDPSKFRHAAPVHYHLTKDQDGWFSARAIAFACAALPNYKTSEAVLGELLAHVDAELKKRPWVPARRPGLRFQKGDRVLTPQGEATVLEDATVASKKIAVDFGDRDIDSVNPRDCTLLD